jgi:hypothetical protein
MLQDTKNDLNFKIKCEPDNTEKCELTFTNIILQNNNKLLTEHLEPNNELIEKLKDFEFLNNDQKLRIMDELTPTGKAKKILNHVDIYCKKHGNEKLDMFLTALEQSENDSNKFVSKTLRTEIKLKKEREIEQCQLSAIPIKVIEIPEDSSTTEIITIEDDHCHDDISISDTEKMNECFYTEVKDKECHNNIDKSDEVTTKEAFYMGIDNGESQEIKEHEDHNDKRDASTESINIEVDQTALNELLCEDNKTHAEVINETMEIEEPYREFENEEINVGEIVQSCLNIETGKTISESCHIYKEEANNSDVRQLCLESE